MPHSRWPLTAASLALLGGPLFGQAPPPLPQFPPPIDVAAPAPVVAPVPAPQRDPLSFAPVVKRVVPAVVSIEGKLRPQPNAPRGRRTELPPGDGPRPGVAAEPQPGIDPGPGFGSGFLIDPSGVVLTNNHVVEDVDSVEVTLTDGRKFTTKDIRRDPKTDLAVIKFDAGGPVPFVEFGDSDAGEVGDRVLAVGAPFGLTGSVTHGIVSAKSRTNLRLNQYEDFLQTDAAINPGNSGGPLVNLDGKVIGITSAIKTRSGGFQGVGLAISSNLAKSVAAQLLKDGVVHRGYLGVAVRDLDADGSAKSGVAVGSGALVSRLYDGSPGVKAGLQVGDVIVAVAGKTIKDSRELLRVVGTLPLGEVADVAVVRAGKVVALRLTVEEQAPAVGANKVPVAPAAGVPAPAAVGPAAVAAQFPDLGLVLAELTPAVAAQLQFPARVKGLVILRVMPQSVAAKAGIVRGAAVVRVDRAAVATVKTFQDALAAADRDKGAVLEMVRPNGDVDFVILPLR